MKEKDENYENLEVEEPKEGESTKSNQQYNFLVKILIILAVIIILEIIYLVFINSSIREKNADISNTNYKKYILDDGNKKLDRRLNKDFKDDYELDEETKRKDNEIKSKEKLTKDFIRKAKRLEKILNNSQSIDEILEINDGKKNKINELKTTLDNINKDFRMHFKSKIVDSWGELDQIKNLVQKNKTEEYEMNQLFFKLCYTYYSDKDGNEINYNEATYAINFNENNLYAIIFNTNAFGRYGIFLTQNNDDNFLIFDINNKKNNTLENHWMKFKFDRQNLKLMLNNIKEYNFENKNKDFDYIKYTNITELEIYKAY